MLRSPSRWCSAAKKTNMWRLTWARQAPWLPLLRGHSGRIWAACSTGLICFSSCFNSNFPAIPLLKKNRSWPRPYGTSGGAGWKLGSRPLRPRGGLVLVPPHTSANPGVAGSTPAGGPSTTAPGCSQSWCLELWSWFPVWVFLTLACR